MRISCTICSCILIALGICGGVYALTGLDALLFICAGNAVAVRTALAVGGVSAIFLAYALAALKPYRGLK